MNEPSKEPTNPSSLTTAEEMNPHKIALSQLAPWLRHTKRGRRVARCGGLLLFVRRSPQEIDSAIEAANVPSALTVSSRKRAARERKGTSSNSGRLKI